MGSRESSGCTLALENDVAALLQEGQNLLENEVKTVSGQVCTKRRSH